MKRTEALTFWLLLGQAKSDKKEILRFALNDKLIVNCQWLCPSGGEMSICLVVGSGFAPPHAGTPCRGEPCVRLFFCVMSGSPNANDANQRK